MNEKIESEKSFFSVFGKNLSPKEKQLISQQSIGVKYQKNDMLVKQETRISHIVYLHSGKVKVFKEGRNDIALIFKIETPGALLDINSLLSGRQHQISAAAIEPVESLHIDKASLHQIYQQNAAFAAQLLAYTGKNALFIEKRFIEHHQKQLPGRTADVLLYFATEIFKNHSFVFPLTRKELAQLAGTTKESFIRTLSEFKHDKIIHLKGKYVEIKSMEILKKLSQFG